MSLSSLPGLQAGASKDHPLVYILAISQAKGNNIAHNVSMDVSMAASAEDVSSQQGVCKELRRRTTIHSAVPWTRLVLSACSCWGGNTVGVAGETGVSSPRRP